MRGQSQTESFVLKHRLTGAAILIGFAVIVLPMLLGGPAEQNTAQDTGGARSESDTKEFVSNITPIGGQTPAARRRAEGDADTTDQAAAPPAAQQAGEAGEGERREQADDQTGESGAASRAGASQEAERSETLERGWIVQVGVFRNPDNVAKLVAKLEQNGFGPATDEVETAEGPATRIWVGPFETRVEAARNKTRVKQRTGSEGLIVAYP